MIVKLLMEHYLAFLSLKGGCKGLSDSTLVKMSNCWKSHAAAQMPLSIQITLRHEWTILTWTFSMFSEQVLHIGQYGGLS